MRIALINEGTYPVNTGGVSTWCDQLVSGMPDHTWEVVTLTGGSRTPITWTVPSQVRSTTLYPVWAPVRAGLPESQLLTRRRRARVRAALRDLWAAILPPAETITVADGTVRHDPALLGAALRELLAAGGGDLFRLLGSESSAEALLDAWWGHSPALDRSARLSVGDAVEAATLVDRTLCATDVRFGDVDVVHASSNGSAALVGLARKWRDGVPLILTEHGVYLRERYLALAGTQLGWSARYAVCTALRAFCVLVYSEADLLLPVSDFNARWAVRLGADPARIHTVRNGVDVSTMTPVGPEPEIPTISFVGRIDPLKDLETLVRAYALVRRELPATRLRIFGPCPTGNARYKESIEETIDELGVTDGVTWEGPTAGPRPAVEAGSIVALSSVSEGLPFTTIEAMMCGRVTVNTDVGGVSEAVGRDGRLGGLVPPRDPEAFAEECLRFLTDDRLREQTGQRGREHALESFALSSCIDTFRGWYEIAAGIHSDHFTGGALEYIASVAS
ncbi:GT4 family glycosyltransferase PelF [Dietzia cinnamea]|uniref:GT4 family glycosyltransferase PelF n=1 Tax=Dietzia cinnamea TaxID=321318 RepID=A0AAW5Q7H7_9ACTN|nr:MULTISPECIES: GT4 family glycosyltransferase PelF [Dietzia]MCT1863036.1 GT4 family glycosyltransferase PelF [Dietzia cinnamea]MCT2029229.1 GT4 family glycosyltransferase PelF [Dietzia cinnamea]MCT2032528.1 GT4 family glycosyltransferase PelF [Dietzia cinnamea]MCT2074848.1 GT4 family glycosyltransferase PelF [Dietzia cinnamea]MCT2105350.1 GT4 family glycosyltransferase PelF [Dietzia cinnamea]